MKGFSLPGISIPSISLPSSISDASQVKNLISSKVPSNVKDLVGNLNLEGEASKILDGTLGNELPDLKDFSF